MKGILLSLIAFLILLLASVLAVRHYRGRKYFHLFLAIFPFSCLLYGLLFYGMPEDLYFLPRQWLEPSPLVDFGNGLLILFLLFHLLWDTAYAMILTGFSSELAVRLFLHKEEGLSAEALLKEFGEDQEIDHILAWRLPNLLKSHYVVAEGNSFRLLRKGKWIAAFSLFLKKLFNMDVEG